MSLGHQLADMFEPMASEHNMSIQHDDKIEGLDDDPNNYLDDSSDDSD